MPENKTIQHLEFLLQEEQAKYARLHDLSKKLIDAAIDYERNRNNFGDVKEKKFLILKSREKALRELFYPKTNASNQAKINWLGQ